MVNFDFSGVKLPAELTSGISKHLNEFSPFALKSRLGYVAVFSPQKLSAWFINSSGITETKCANQMEFFNLIGVTVLSHREFIQIPPKALPFLNDNKQIE